VAGVWANSITLSHQGEPEFVRIGFVTPDFFPLLGVQPAEGRLFAQADEVDGHSTSILLSHGLWQRRFGSDPAVVGRAITVNDQPTIVGAVRHAHVRGAVAGARSGGPRGLPVAGATRHGRERAGRSAVGVAPALAPAREVGRERGSRPSVIDQSSALIWPRISPGG
jgi:hypothetical protein